MANKKPIKKSSKKSVKGVQKLYVLFDIAEVARYHDNVVDDTGIVMDSLSSAEKRAEEEWEMDHGEVEYVLGEIKVLKRLPSRGKGEFPWVSVKK